MKKFNRSRNRNRNVQASEDLIKSVADRVIEYLTSIGFAPCGRVGYNRVLAKSISPAINNSLYLFLGWGKVRIYQGIRTGKRISAHKLHECSVYDLEETIGLLAERNYL